MKTGCMTHITVAAVIERSKKFLLVREIVKNCEVYNQPAGHLEENESLTDAVRRETFEETGTRFEPQSIIGIYHFQEKYGCETWLRIAFGGTILSQGSRLPPDKDIIEAVWLNAAAIHALAPAQLRSPMVLACIEDYMKPVRYPLSLLTHISSRSDSWRR